MPSNKAIADHLFQLGQMYLLKKDRWRSRTFLNAAKIIEDMTEPAMWADLKSLDGIGQSVEEAVAEFCKTGTCKRFEELALEFPDLAPELQWIPGIGPVKAQELVKKWQVKTLDGLLEALEHAGEAGSELHGKVLEGLHRRDQGRLARSTVQPFAEQLVTAISACEHVRKVEIAGSWRRERLTIKDLDILVATDEAFLVQAHDEVLSVAEWFGNVTSAGPIKIRFTHTDKDYAIDVDILLVDENCWGAALCYFTGSKSHNERMRSIAKVTGLKINEYGIFRDGMRIGGQNEGDLYEILGLEFVLPRDRRA